MDRKLAIIIILFASSFASSQSLQSISNYVKQGSTPVTWTIVQHVINKSNTTVACAVTVSAINAGNLVIYSSSAAYSGTVATFDTGMDLSSVTGSGETFVKADPFSINDAASSDATIYANGTYYTLSAVGGETSISGTWTLNGLGTPTQKTTCEVVEVHPSATPIFFDTANSFYNTNSCTSCGAPAGLLNGNSDYVFQSGTSPSLAFTAISGTYSNPFDSDSGSNNVHAQFAGALNVASYSAPNWTEASGHQPNYLSFAAFTGVANPSPTFNLYIDFSGLTNGVSPTNTTFGNSVHSGWGTAGSDVTSSSTGMTGCTPGSGNSLMPVAVLVNGTSYTGSTGTLDLCGVTNATGTHTGYVGFGFCGGQCAPSSAMVAFSMKSSCAANVECGAQIRLVTSFSHYAIPHLSPNGDGHFCLETDGAGASCSISEGGTYAPNTWYRINYTLTVGGGTDRMVVCNDGPGGSVVMSTTALNNADVAGIADLQVGITGEEPTTVGTTYEWRNVLFIPGTMLYSTSRCL